ncbi:carbon storage regulator [Cohnella endophytica]|uniref:Translational regulator CsrA n=1 Tax=Cohnella endophytica TaxID=2419778 RepID=A0A494XGP6_9BACL|nr:carbon storage regulator CsrA [Cohnella endophytica]RKP47254.1 carbon storage regulator [Cohnella endophytica]
MLILSRKAGQSILIGNNIEIIVTAVDGDQVKIGINAPPEIVILRKEVLDSIEQSNREAASPKAFLEKIKKL